MADWVAGVVFLRTCLHKQQQTHRHTPCVHVGQPDVLHAQMVCDAQVCMWVILCAAFLWGFFETIFKDQIQSLFG